MIGLVKKHIWLIPTILFAILVFWGSTLHPLWGDEAETAFYARVINMRGLPYAFDKVNVTSLVSGVALDSNLLNHVTSWLQFYLVAISFRFFGQSSFTARLPFVLFSVLNIPLVYFLTLKLTKKNSIALLAASTSVLSVPFVLFSYQARYYSLTIFFGLCMLLSAINLSKGKIAPKLIFVLSTIFYLYSQYVSAVIFYVAVFFGLIIDSYYKKKSFKQILKISGIYLGIGFLASLFFLPWCFILKPTAGQGEVFSSLGQIIKSLPIWFYIGARYFNDYNVFPVLFLPLLVFVIFIKLRRKKDAGGLILLSSITFFYLFLVAGISAYVLTENTFFTEIRYNLILLPLFFIINATLFYEIWCFKKWLFVIIFGIYISTNLFTLKPFKSLPFEYVKEMLNPYKTSNEAIADYLKKNAKDGDTAFVNSDRAHEPLMFLLGDKIKFVNRLSPINPVIFPNGYKFLPKYIYAFLGNPDWVILYSTHDISKAYFDFDLRGFYPEGINPSVDLQRDYDEVILPIFYGADITRPELDVHFFSQIQPKYDEQVFIYHLKKKKRFQ